MDDSYWIHTVQNVPPEVCDLHPTLRSVDSSQLPVGTGILQQFQRDHSPLRVSQLSLPPPTITHLLWGCIWKLSLLIRVKEVSMSSPDLQHPRLLCLVALPLQKACQCFGRRGLLSASWEQMVTQQRIPAPRLLRDGSNRGARCKGFHPLV